MKSHLEVGKFLFEQMKKLRISQVQLTKSAGLAPRTLYLMLAGSRDYRLGTLFAVADRLGLEVVLVPKAVAGAMQAGTVTEPAVKSVVQAALETVWRGTPPDFDESEKKDTLK